MLSHPAFHTKYGEVHDLCHHPTLVAYCKDLLGPDVICWGVHFICKEAGSKATVTWHQVIHVSIRALFFDDLTMDGTGRSAVALFADKRL